VRVHYDEGIANHIGPEPCAGIREDVGEASVGERAGQPLSHDRTVILGSPYAVIVSPQPRHAFGTLAIGSAANRT
jgi:hypothetical protein